MDFKSLTDWIIRGIVAFFLMSAIEFMKETKVGLQDLSVKLAVIVEKVTNQSSMLELHERRIQKLEDKK
jgi:hypothetical protein